MSPWNQAMNFIGLCAWFGVQWVRVTSWHLYRIATFRPSFTTLGDTGIVVVSGFVLLIAAAVLRWYVCFDVDIVMTLVAILKGVFFISILFERSGRSSGLVAAAAMASAAADLLASAGWAVGLLNGPGDTADELRAYELGMTAVCAFQFLFVEPEEVRRRGYRRQSAPPAAPGPTGGGGPV